ncbi:hypothetical protein AYJ54_18205 [Bradyrhizobium centrolobii]|uniref:GntR C-terminal domain-containing protein n=1 Tax=Bradyrhizobium centrolobii TaxID=1505087 RepID=A0A176YM62_9BRAD|nr:hypothetical protein AYJ54_18205 [Bradyrhizobium centrolobii]
MAALRANPSSPFDVQTPASFDAHRALLPLLESGNFAAFETLMTSRITNSGLPHARALQVKHVRGRFSRYMAVSQSVQT